MTEPEESTKASFSRSGPLSDDDRAVLAMERLWWQYAGAKEQAIRDKFDVSPTRYYQVLTRLIDREEALAYDPLVVNRLREVRAAKVRQNSAHKNRDDD